MKRGYAALNTSCIAAGKPMLNYFAINYFAKENRLVIFAYVYY